MDGLPPLYPTFPSSSQVMQLEVLDREWSYEDGKMLDKFLAENDYGLPRTNEVNNMVHLVPSTDQAQHISINSTTIQGRQKPLRWTDEEHRSFLMGLDEHGKGDWSSISKNFVVTKTPSQVASHAQKYFRRLKCTTPVEKRRHSIHDTRIVNSKIVDIPPRSIQPNFNRDPPVFYIPNPPTQFWAEPSYMNF